MFVVVIVFVVVLVGDRSSSMALPRVLAPRRTDGWMLVVAPNLTRATSLFLGAVVVGMSPRWSAPADPVRGRGSHQPETLRV